MAQVATFHSMPYLSCVGIVEQVINGNSLRLCLPATHHQFTAQITGIRCPGTGQQSRDTDSQDDPELGQRAKYAVEIRLLQRDVKIRFDGINNQVPLVTVLHVVSCCCCCCCCCSSSYYYCCCCCCCCLEGKHSRIFATSCLVRER